MSKENLNITITETIILEETQEELQDEQKPITDILNVVESKDDLNENSAALTQKLLDYIEALKFSPTASSPDNPTPQNDTDTLVSEFLGGKKMNKKGGKSKSKVKFTTRKIPSGFEQTFGVDPSVILNNAQPPPPIGPGRKIKKKSYTKIIREWGRRPMLIESEAPWTYRNRIYSNAVQALSGNTGQNQTNFPYVVQGANNFGASNYFSNSSWLVPNSYPGTNLKFPPVLSDATPIITGISPMPGAPDANTVPTGVALESPYTYQEFVVPISPMAPQRQQQVLFNGNSQVSWVPIIPQQQLITYVDRNSYDGYSVQEIPFLTPAN